MYLGFRPFQLSCTFLIQSVFVNYSLRLEIIDRLFGLNNWPREGSFDWILQGVIYRQFFVTWDNQCLKTTFLLYIYIFFFFFFFFFSNNLTLSECVYFLVTLNAIDILLCFIHISARKNKLSTKYQPNRKSQKSTHSNTYSSFQLFSTLLVKTL